MRGTKAWGELAPMLLLACAPLCSAQDYPVKPVRIVIGFPPGGPNELTARPVAQKLQEFLGQPFILDHRPGANSIIATELVAKSPPDGYALLFVSTAFSINPSSYAKLPYDPVRDFAPVSPLAAGDIVLVVNPVVPARSLKELIALARARPGKLNFASSGAGGSLHLSGELFKQVTGVDMVHVPYKGAAPALTEVIGGHVDSMFIAAPPAIPHIRSAKVRALGVASAQRAPALPEVPTMAEGGLRGFEVASGYGIVVAAKTPAALVARLNEAIGKAVTSPEVKERFSAIGLRPETASAAQFTERLHADIVRWRKVVAAARLVPQ